MQKTYLELINLPTFEERFEYLKCNGRVAHETFGSHRWVNQKFYSSPEWKRIRRKVIIRDQGCDLGIEDRVIQGKLLIHHINPVSIDDLLNCNPEVFDLNNLICVSHETHEAIHYGDMSLLMPSQIVERRPGDTCPWKKNASSNTSCKSVY